jgi:hypothetical protein
LQVPDKEEDQGSTLVVTPERTSKEGSLKRMRSRRV